QMWTGAGDILLLGVGQVLEIWLGEGFGCRWALWRRGAKVGFYGGGGAPLRWRWGGIANGE
ncbi:MAG: hypothetical protein RR728_07635, partial [Oscillospiraceae bacterium]